MNYPLPGVSLDSSHSPSHSEHGLSSSPSSYRRIGQENFLRSSENKKEFFEFLSQRQSLGVKSKGKSAAWKKFLNLKAGIIEDEVVEKKLPPIKLDNKSSQTSQRQQLIIALLQKLRVAESQETDSAKAGSENKGGRKKKLTDAECLQKNEVTRIRIN